jgi:hypothetical protein
MHAHRVKSPRIVSAALLAACLLSGCQSKPPPDEAMTTSPTGLWTGVSNPDVSLDIQEGGFFKITRGGQETIGEWKMEGPGTITITLNGSTSTTSFERRDLVLKITLPGESTVSEFSQM